MKQVARFSFGLLLLLLAFLSVPSEVKAAMTCSDCLRLCFLQKCGVFMNPACVAANNSFCQNHCAASCG